MGLDIIQDDIVLSHLRKIGRPHGKFFQSIHNWCSFKTCGNTYDKNNDIIHNICFIKCLHRSQLQIPDFLKTYIIQENHSRKRHIDQLLTTKTANKSFWLVYTIWISYWATLQQSVTCLLLSKIIILFNYVNPVCCVATVCHQVRCMYWGHFGHFQRAISHLKWHKIVYMRYLACTFSRMKCINMFSMFLQSGVPRHFVWRFIAVWIYNLTVFMFMYVNVDLKL